MMRFHPSSIGNLMGAPKSLDPAFLADPYLAEIYGKKKKTDEDKAILEPYWERTLSEGAKTYLKGLARQELFGYRTIVDTKVLRKGIMVEDETIDLYNRVFFKRYAKNTERRTNDWLTGECDIYDLGVCTLDAKSVWSLDTFPLLAEDAHDPAYEWQGVAYGILWPDAKEHIVFFGAVDTPEELIAYLSDDEKAAHRVSHIDPAQRVTRIVYPKDPEKERRLEVKARIGQLYLENLIERFKEEHGLTDDELSCTTQRSPAPTNTAPDWRTEFLS